MLVGSDTTSSSGRCNDSTSNCPSRRLSSVMIQLVREELIRSSNSRKATGRTPTMRRTSASLMLSTCSWSISSSRERAGRFKNDRGTVVSRVVVVVGGMVEAVAVGMGRMVGGGVTCSTTEVSRRFSTRKVLLLICDTPATSCSPCMHNSLK